MPVRLTVPIREAQRVHLQRRAQGVLRQIATTLRRANIRAKARVQLSSMGRPRVVVYVQGRGEVEAMLLLRPTIDGFSVVVV